MLVLTRKKQEVIQIGDDITITVLRLKGKTVRLGISAPMEKAVLRGELIDAVTAPNVAPPSDALESDLDLAPGSIASGRSRFDARHFAQG